MKRVPRKVPESGNWLPTFVPEAGGRQGMFRPGEYRTSDGPVRSSCLACSDAPCRLFSEEEVLADVGVPTPVSPSRSVCPVEAIYILGSSLIPEIDADICLGCGLCVARCPVGALSLDPTAAAVIQVPASPAYVEAIMPVAEFESARTRLAKMLAGEDSLLVDASLVARQVIRFDAGLAMTDRERVLELFVRNVFLTLDHPARMKNTGDNTAFAELTVGLGDALLLLEIEATGGEVDAFRRVISGIAVAASRYHVELDRIIAGVVVVRLPNARVDYYESVKNAADRISVVVRTVPVAALLLGLRSGDGRLVELLMSRAVVNSDDLNSLESQVKEIWGAVPGAGLSPTK